MPELPEVETTRRGIAPHIKGHTVTDVIVRDARLRWPVPKHLARSLCGQCIDNVERRGKYLLLKTQAGALIMHLGMSGSLRVLPADSPAEKHDHVDIVFDNRLCLRLRDPRRFGSIFWTRNDPLQHERLAKLGPEPLDKTLDGEYLFARSRGRKIAIKQFIMDSHIVVGVGNIYASESLFRAGIHPQREAGRISKARYERLSDAIKKVISEAIQAGGTTLRDFTRSDGKPGYFSQQLNVYGREGEACPQCGASIKHIVQGQRATYYCGHCQR
ncbi:MAG: bifunctional DNA-formamidopyrimidine glycosylase/DNA-(apurinic or apyrimidinic site) lyase [Granulosicoccaceae bacterium]|jgi:formamidopyrimidine-DNA glycosylase